jgi:3-hydroxyisobutyrate dehydrogenase-like beta-hydroxyacid dehydrogenase
VARCQPLFDAMGQKTFDLGEKPSAANLVKLSGNFLITVVIESLGETVALTRKAGIDRPSRTAPPRRATTFGSSNASLDRGARAASNGAGDDGDDVHPHPDASLRRGHSRARTGNLAHS